MVRLKVLQDLQKSKFLGNGSTFKFVRGLGKSKGTIGRKSVLTSVNDFIYLTEKTVLLV